MNSALKLAVWLALFFVAIGPLVHVLKMIRVSQDLGAYFFYAGFPLVTAFLIFGGSWEPNNPSRRPNLFLGLIVGMLLASSVLTFFHGGETDDIIGNAFRLIFAFASMFFLTNAAGAYNAFLSAGLLLVAKMFLITSLAGTLLMHFAAFVGFSVYYGLQTTAAFIPFAYGLVSQRMPFVLISLVPLIGSGKRGGMLGAFVILIAYAAMAVGRVRLGRVVTAAAVLSAVFVSLYAFQLLPQAIVSRLDFLFSQGDVDLNQITSGRVVEASAALDRLNSFPLAWLTGFGLGSAVNLDAFPGSAVSTIHFSPLGMVMIFGVPLTVLFYSAIIYYTYEFFRLCRGGLVGREFVVLYLVFVAEIAFSFTAFTILQSYMLWLSLAYLVATRSRVPAQSVVAIPANRSLVHGSSS